MRQGELSACKNIEGLMAAINIRYSLEKWQLFIDCSMHSLKAMLLHKANVLTSILVAYAIHKEETYENMEDILSCVKYKTYQWRICCDFKVIALLMGLQKGYTKFCYCLCEWASHDKSVHCRKQNWLLLK
jgi:hypothetical protein